MSRAKVLIVEDDPLVAMTTREVLTLVGFEVTGVAATVSDALCLAENTRPDLAIFDVRLAGKRDGIEGAALLRQRLGLPVVFVSAEEDAATRSRAAALEPVAVLEKPVHPRQLITAIESAIGGADGSNK